MGKEWQYFRSGGIQDYLMNRLQNNQSWYDKKQLLTHQSELSISSQAIFGLIYFLIMEQLKLGHTVLSLRDDKHITDDKLNLTAWQSTLITPVITMIQESFNHQKRVDFQQWFCAIDKSHHDFKRVETYINHDVPADLTHASEMATQATLNTQTLGQFKQLTQWILWFYYDSKYRLGQSFEYWIDELSCHVFFGGVGSDKPIIYIYRGGVVYFWLHRSFYAEQKLLAHLHQISHTSVPALTIDVNPKFNKEQQQAVHTMSHHALSIITGGPGTGKTFTVASVVKALLVDESLDLALVAPTGKAAQRMKEALENNLGHLDNELIKRLPEPMTIHRLLGIGKSGVPRHHATNPLSYELIIVDEASMLGVELAMWLLSAVKSGSRLILLGDAYQLSAVDAGAVLADLCRLPQLQNVRTQLISSQRFDDGSGVGKLAKLIHQPTQTTWEQFWALISPKNQLVFFDISANNTKWFYDNLIMPYKAYFDLIKQLKSSFHAMNKKDKIKAMAQLMTVFNQYRILTASHLSYCGDVMINQHIASTYQENYLNNATNYHWYHGRPVMILKNRYDLGLYNGDIGICLQSGRYDNQLQVYFYDNNDIRSFNISVLGGDVVSTAYAMTIHKSQGSEFNQVAICFDKTNERLLSKELIYTAVTRAKEYIEIYSTPQAVLDAINKPTIRQTGLEILSTMMGEN